MQARYYVPKPVHPEVSAVHYCCLAEIASAGAAPEEVVLCVHVAGNDRAGAITIAKAALRERHPGAKVRIDRAVPFWASLALAWDDPRGDVGDTCPHLPTRCHRVGNDEYTTYAPDATRITGPRD
jgi:hypothetical protein